MKKLILSLLTITLCACNQASQNVTLNLDLTGLADSTEMVIELAGTYDPQDPIQTVALASGKAQFSFDAEGPRGYYVHPANAYGYIMVVLSPGENATLTATYENVERGEGKTAYNVKDEKVTGSETDEYYLANKADREALNVLYEKYHEDAKDVLAELSKYERGSAEYNAIMETDAYKKFAEDEKNFFETVEEKLMAPVYAHKDSWWGPFFLTTEMNYLTEEQKEVYDQFSDEAKNSFYGAVVRDKVAPPSIEGTQMPDFTFTDHATGKKMSLYEICKNNKYILIDFWASWCGPCRREIPNFKSQYELYHEKGFEVVSISADEKEDAWLKALEEEQLPWPNDIDGDKGICKLYKVSAYPTVYVLDSEAKAVAKDMDARGENLRTLLADLFK